jgi:hypothetical protein
MNRAWRPLLAAAGIAAVIALFFVLRDNGNDGKATTTRSTTTSTRTTTNPTPPPPATQVATIVFRNSRVRGGLQHISTTRGKRLVILVSADVSDEVHLHGYDRKGDVAPGAPARIRFRATIPGRFVIELESRSLQIGELEVRP